MPRHKSSRSAPSSPEAQTPLTVCSLHYYPIKSCAGIDLIEATIDRRGIKDDRAWLIVDDEYGFITQRDCAALALIKATVSGSTQRQLKLEAPEMPPLTVLERMRPEAGYDLHGTEIWGQDASGVDQGDEPAEWLTKYLGRKARLLRKSLDEIRDVKAINEDAPKAEVSFQDGYPFLIVSQASLDDLNSRLAAPLPMNRFRPNIVIEGASPFGEDRWHTIKIGEVVFEIDKPCARCTITTIDQQTLAKSVEPLKTLATFRNQNQGVMFGQNAIHANSGIIRVNDKVEVIKYKVEDASRVPG